MKPKSYKIRVSTNVVKKDSTGRTAQAQSSEFILEPSERASFSFDTDDISSFGRHIPIEGQERHHVVAILRIKGDDFLVVQRDDFGVYIRNLLNDFSDGAPILMSEFQDYVLNNVAEDIPTNSHHALYFYQEAKLFRSAIHYIAFFSQNERGESFHNTISAESELFSLNAAMRQALEPVRTPAEERPAGQGDDGDCMFGHFDASI